MSLWSRSVRSDRNALDRLRAGERTDAEHADVAVDLGLREADGSQGLGSDRYDDNCAYRSA